MNGSVVRDPQSLQWLTLALARRGDAFVPAHNAFVRWSRHMGAPIPAPMAGANVKVSWVAGADHEMDTSIPGATFIRDTLLAECVP